MSSRRRVVRPSSSSVSSTRALRKRNRKNKVVIAAEPTVFPDEYALMPRLSSGPKPNGFRDGEFLHVSDLLNKCIRMIALSDRFGSKLSGEPLWDNMLVTFAIGNAIHDFVRYKVGATSPGDIYGTWSCVCEQSRHTGTKAEAEAIGACEVCNKPLDQYHEFCLENTEYMITGSVDLTLLIDGIFYFTEIKSIKKEDWDAINRPLPLHILQIVFYWWLARQLNLPVYDKVSVLYVTKGHVFGSPYKEFVIDPAEHVHRLDPYLEDAKALKEAKEGGDLPIRLCPEIRSPQAKKCEEATVCFSIDQ